MRLIIWLLSDFIDLSFNFLEFIIVRALILVLSLFGLFELIALSLALFQLEAEPVILSFYVSIFICDFLKLSNQLFRSSVVDGIQLGFHFVEPFHLDCIVSKISK